MTAYDYYGRPYDVKYKIIIIGESRIGKTSILKRLETNQFHENTISTVGLDFVNFYHKIDNVRVHLQIWDTAGQERFRTITRSHFRNAKGIIFTFDISNKDSFDMLEYWFQSLEIDDDNIDNPIIYLVGNKSDLVNDRELSFVEAKNFADKNLIKYYETSAKTGKNLKEMFESLAFDILDANDMIKMDRYKKQSVNDSFVYAYNIPKEIDLNAEKPIKKKRNKVVNIFFKKCKNKNSAVVSFGEQPKTKNQKFMHKFETIKSPRSIHLHDSKRNKLNLNCCKVS